MTSSGCCDDRNINEPEQESEAVTTPKKESLFSKIRRRGRLQIEPIESDPRKLFYLPESSTCSEFKFSRTESSCCLPKVKHIVKFGDPFEIKVVGFQVAKHDRAFSARSGNEIIVSSTQAMSNSTEGELHKIHFNYEKNRTKNSHKPNTYVTVPHGKRYLFSDAGHKTQKIKEEIHITRKTKTKAVDVALKIVEVDKLAKPIVSAFSEVNELQNASKGFKGVPVLATISPLLGFASMIGKRAMESYTTNDLVLEEAFSMRLAKNEFQEAGPYLRYGYYFVISEYQKFKLYACDCTSDNMKLHVKEVASGKYHPLNNVDYIVLQVSQPTGEFPTERNYSQATDVKSRMKSILRLVKEKKKDNLLESSSRDNNLDPETKDILKRLESFESLAGINSDSE